MYRSVGMCMTWYTCVYQRATFWGVISVPSLRGFQELNLDTMLAWKVLYLSTELSH